LYLKLLIAKKEFDKAAYYLTGEGAKSFELWVESRTWMLKILIDSE
jgi:hypothetical protein